MERLLPDNLTTLLSTSIIVGCAYRMPNCWKHTTAKASPKRKEALSNAPLHIYCLGT